MDTLSSSLLIDVIGVVTHTGPANSIVTKAKKDLLKRNVTLLDVSCYTIELTLWSNTAANPGWSEDAHPILALKGVRVSDFSGNNIFYLLSWVIVVFVCSPYQRSICSIVLSLYLSIYISIYLLGKTLTTVSSTNMEVNPDLTEAHTLRGWYDAQGGQMNTYPLTTPFTGGGGGGDGGNVAANRPTVQKTLSQVKDESLGLNKVDYFMVKGYVSHIKHDNSLWYLSCPTPGCQKKVNEVDSEYFCEKCNARFPNYDMRYDPMFHPSIYLLNSISIYYIY